MLFLFNHSNNTSTTTTTYLKRCLVYIFLVCFITVNVPFCSGKNELISVRDFTSNNADVMMLSSPPSTSRYKKTKRNLKDSSNLELDYCSNCDMYIGGLFPVHAPKYMRQTAENVTNTNINNNSTSIPLRLDKIYLNDISCGEIKKERGIQRLEAMLFAIDLINNSTKLLPNIRLGAKIYDTCDRDTIALEKCLHFVNYYFLLNNENIVNDFSCDHDEATSSASSSRRNGGQSLRNSTLVPKKKYDAIYKRKVIGVIGAASSSVSIQVANLLRLFKVNEFSCGTKKISQKGSVAFFGLFCRQRLNEKSEITNEF